jgi:K+-transporting ATPase c subunit
MRPWLGIVGEARVNVLALNLALDGKVAQPAR